MLDWSWRRTFTSRRQHVGHLSCRDDLIGVSRVDDGRCRRLVSAPADSTPMETVLRSVPAADDGHLGEQDRIDQGKWRSNCPPRQAASSSDRGRTRVLWTTHHGDGRGTRIDQDTCRPPPDVRDKSGHLGSAGEERRGIYLRSKSKSFEGLAAGRSLLQFACEQESAGDHPEDLGRRARVKRPVVAHGLLQGPAGRRNAGPGMVWSAIAMRESRPDERTGLSHTRYDPGSSAGFAGRRRGGGKRLLVEHPGT